MKQGYGRERIYMSRHSDGNSYSSFHNQLWDKSGSTNRTQNQFRKFKKPIEKAVYKEVCIIIKKIDGWKIQL